MFQQKLMGLRSLQSLRGQDLQGQAQQSPDPQIHEKTREMWTREHAKRRENSRF